MRSAVCSSCMVLAVLRKAVTRFVCQDCKNVHMCCSVQKMCETQRMYVYGRPSGSCARIRVCEARSSCHICPRTGRVGMVRRVKGLSAILFKGAVGSVLPKYLVRTSAGFLIPSTF